MTNLVLTPALKPDPNKLDEAYEVVVDDQARDGAITIRVPKFFQFDGASIPWAAQPLIGTPFEPRFMGASVFHDWLYHTHQIPRAAADELFYGLLLADGVSKTKAWLMREAVVVGGGGYWNNDADDLAYIARLTARIVADHRDPKDYGL